MLAACSSSGTDDECDSDIADFLESFHADSDDGELQSELATSEPEPEPEPERQPQPDRRQQPLGEQPEGEQLAAQLQRWLPNRAKQPCQHTPATVNVQQAGMRCTGGWVWEGAKELDIYLLHSVESFAGLRVLELGAGVGWLAQRLASLGAQVVATEQAAMLPSLQLNIAKVNAHNGSDQTSELMCAELDWLDVMESTHAAESREPAVVTLTRQMGGWDIIVGSDCVYMQEFFVPLLRTLSAAVQATLTACAKTPRIFLSAEHRSRSHVKVDRNLAPAVFFDDASNDAERLACEAAKWDIDEYGFRSTKVWEKNKDVQGNRVACYELIVVANNIEDRLSGGGA